MRKSLVFVLFLVLSWLGSFGIAFAVVEWRDDDSFQDSRFSSERFEDEFCDIVLSIDGLAFRVADIGEFVGVSYGDLTPSQTARDFVREHPIAPDFRC